MKEFDWLEPVLDRLSGLLRMPGTHNSYGTPKADPSCAWTALRMMGEANVRILPVPEISPNMAGGLCFVWHGVETACSLSVFPEEFGAFGVNVSSWRGDVLLESGDACPPERHLKETLNQISMEVPVP